MSTATAKHPGPEPEYGHLVRLTVQACQVAKEAASAAAEGIATGSTVLLNSLRQREKELDRLDMEIDDGVTDAITRVSASEARELLACMKFMIGLERIGDLLKYDRSQLLGRAIKTSRLIGVPDRDCLQRSLLLYRVLSRAGANPRLVVGVRRTARLRTRTTSS